jgi:hypothetical protein
MVAGFDYERKGFDFPIYARNRIDRTIKKFHGESLRFTLFDIGGATVTKTEIDGKTGKRTEAPVNLGKVFTAVTAANYSVFAKGVENEFDQNTAGVMSVTDVYGFIEGIGKGKDAGSVAEFHFFAHSWPRGPILVNYTKLLENGTPDAKYNVNSTPRDADDKDARFKDFGIMGSDQLTSLKKAFVAGAVIWVWGCNWSTPLNLIFSVLFKNRKMVKMPLNRLTPENSFDLEFNEDLTVSNGTRIFEWVMKNLPGGKVSGKKSRTYKVTIYIYELINLLQQELKYDYLTNASNKLGTIGYGALPGTFADLEKNVPLPLLLVPTNYIVYNNNFSKTISFYQLLLGFTLDPENRGYAKF